MASQTGSEPGITLGRRPLGDAASTLLFTNHSHLTADFKRVLGVSPQTYQRAAGS